MLADGFAFATEHARKFGYAAFVVQFNYVGVGSSFNFFLADRKLVLGAASHLVQVRNREHLVVLA